MKVFDLGIMSCCVNVWILEIESLRVGFLFFCGRVLLVVLMLILIWCVVSIVKVLVVFLVLVNFFLGVVVELLGKISVVL